METPAETLTSIVEAYADDRWEGKSPDELLAEWSNYSDANISDDGAIYFNGTYRTQRTSNQPAKFVQWLRDRQVIQ